MTRGVEAQPRAIDKHRHGALEFACKACARKQRIHQRNRLRSRRQRRVLAAQARSQLVEYAHDFRGLVFGELHQVIVAVQGFQRLNEHRLTRRACAVNDARHVAALRRTHRYHKPVVAQRDVVLARLFAARANDTLQIVQQFFAGLADRAADALQLRRCVVADLSIRQNCPANRFGQAGEVRQRAGAFREARVFCGFMAKRQLQCARRLDE